MKQHARRVHINFNEGATAPSVVRLPPTSQSRFIERHQTRRIEDSGRHGDGAGRGRMFGRGLFVAAVVFALFAHAAAATPWSWAFVVG